MGKTDVKNAKLMEFINDHKTKYTIGVLHKHYIPIWCPKGAIIAECLNMEDAEQIVNALNKTYTLA